MSSRYSPTWLQRNLAVLTALLDRSHRRQLVALIIAAFIVLQPVLVTAQRPTRSEIEKPQSGTVISARLSGDGLGVPKNSTPQSFPFSQNWTNTALITASDNWSGVPGIEGFFLRNDGLSTTGTDPQTLLGDAFGAGTTNVELDVTANQANSTSTTGGMLEVHTTSQAAPSNANPTIAFQGSATADAPFILLNLNTTGWTNINVSYNLRDLDCSIDDAQQQVALQFRAGNSGGYTNVAAGYVSDATARSNAAATDTANCTLVTAVNQTLPAGANNQPLVQVRIMTTNAGGNDEMVGVDDISVTATPTLNISDATVLEGNAGPTTATFTVSLPQAAGPGGVTFDIATADGTAQDDNPGSEDNDYVAKSLTGQTIPEGSSSYPFEVTVNGDINVEPNETFFVNVTNITGVTAGDTQGQGTIQNDDSPPDLSISDVTQAETNGGTTTFTFNVTLSSPAGASGVTFDVNTADGTTNPANAGSDYVAITGGSGSITSGNSATTVVVTVNGDAMFEPDETFFVNLTNVTGANVLDGQGLGTITNDDAQPAISIADVAITEGSAGTQLLTFTVTLSGTSQDTITVNYATADSSATLADVDYVSAGDTLTFLSGDTSETFAVTINGDTNVEGDEMFLVNLSGASGATISDNQALGIIFLDDALGLSAIDTAFSTNFDVMDLTGFSATTPAAWTRAESGANANLTYGADNGFLGTGNTYSYGTTASTDRALGGLQSGSLVPTFGAFFRNDTGATVTSLLVSYTGEQWRFGATGRTDRLDFQYSTDATSLTTGTWTDADGLDFTSPFTSSDSGDIGQRDGNAAGNRTAISSEISGLSIAPGATFWIRYNDSNASGADDGLAVDDFSIIANPTPPDTAPSVTSTTPTDNATGVALAANISVTFNEAVSAPAGAWSISCTTSGAHGFALSTADNTTFTLNPSSDFALNEACTVTVDAAQVTDADSDDPPNNMAADYVFDFTTVGTLPTLSINDVTQSEGNVGTTAFTFTVSLNTSTHGGVTFDICTADDTAQDDTPATEDNDYAANCVTGQIIANGSDTYQFTVNVNGDSIVESTETFFVNITNVTGATVSDGQGLGTITNDDAIITPIHTIQGSGDTSPIPGANITTTGIVTLLRTGSNAGGGAANGFFLQDPNADADPNTSEGIFVFTNSVPTYTSPPTPVAVGDEVFVTGTVTEFNGLTEIGSVTNITVIDTGNTLPTAVTLDSTILDPTALPTKPQLEKYESMRMFSTSLKSVAPNDNFFDVYTVLSSVPRSMREAGIERSLPVPPDPTSGTPDCCIPIWDENPERIKLDFNGRAGAPNNFYTSNVTFTSVSGPLDFAFSEWRLIPDAAPSASANMSAVPLSARTASEFTVAGFNIENFNNNATQRQKAARGIRDIMRLPDIIGVVEIFNLASLQALRDEVNTISPGAAYEAYLIPTPVAGITQNVGYLVNTARVDVDSVTQEQVSDTYIDPANGQPDDTHDRPPLVLRANVDPTGANLPVIVVVNHPRSFIDAGLVAGAGPTVRAKRKAQAESLAELFQELQTNNPTTSVIAVGDYNAYQFNSGYDDSMAVMRGSPTADDQIVVDQSLDVVNPNFSNLIENVPADQRYSFIFEGTPQVLDHVLANTVALSRNTRIAIAHMNADFPGDPASAYASNASIPEHNSDHDAPVAYFSLAAPQSQGTLIISEFRFRGPGNILMDTSSVTGAPAFNGGPKLIVASTSQSQDEFVEIYNNTDASITVSTTDGSAGWTLVASTGSELCRIDNGTVIPARGHYLCTNAGGYSLNGYATGDTAWIGVDIPDGGGVALFRTNNPTNYTLAERLDAAGYVGVDALYREGVGFPLGGGEILGNIQYSFFRTMTRATGGLPKDTGDNAADFKGVATDMTATGQGQNLGAPGPENLSSPINRNSQFTVTLLDPAASATAPPNRLRDPNDTGANKIFGTMTVRRTFTNNTGEPVTRLRFRIVEITTFPAPPGQAELRALSSTDTVVTVNSVPVDVRGTTVEEPPAQPFGGGWNTSLSVPYVTGGPPSAFTSEGIIQLNAPVNSGESISVQFLLGVMQAGYFTFYLNIEASNDPCAGPAFAPCELVGAKKVN